METSSGEPKAGRQGAAERDPALRPQVPVASRLTPHSPDSGRVQSPSLRPADKAQRDTTVVGTSIPAGLPAVVAELDSEQFMTAGRSPYPGFLRLSTKSNGYGTNKASKGNFQDFFAVRAALEAACDMHHWGLENASGTSTKEDGKMDPKPPKQTPPHMYDYVASWLTTGLPDKRPGGLEEIVEELDAVQAEADDHQTRLHTLDGTNNSSYKQGPDLGGGAGKGKAKAVKAPRLGSIPEG